MRLLGNILWHFPCFGFVTSLFSFLAGILLTVTVVGAPIGLGLIQYAKFALAPYSYSMIDKRELHPNKSGNILYAILCLIVRILYFPLGVLFFLVGHCPGRCHVLHDCPVADGDSLCKVAVHVLQPGGQGLRSRCGHG